MSETSSHFVAVCPNCLVALKVRVAYNGSYVRCKHCEHKFRAFAPDHLVTPSSEEYQAPPLGGPASAVERIDVTCPNCAGSLNVRSDLAGQHIRCKLCDHSFLVQKIEEIPAEIPRRHPESEVLDQIYAQPGESRPADAEPRAVEQRPEFTGELTAIREENERLSARLETLQQDHAAIQSERESLLAQLEQFRGDHDRVQTENEQGRQAHQHLRNELAVLRDSLEDLSPDEIVVLRKEHQALSDANQQLSDQVQGLRTELSSGQGLAQTVADREAEIRQASVQAEELRQQIEQLDDRLNGVQGERDRLAEQLRDLEEQLGKSKAQRDELDERVAQHAQALDGSQARSNELAEQLRLRDDALATKLGELDRLAALRQADAAEAEELRGTLTRREQELGQQCHELRGQIDSIRRSHASAEQAHGDERSRLEEQLRAAQEEFESARSEIGALQARQSELLDQLNKTRADHLEATAAQRSKLEAEYYSGSEAQRSKLEAEFQAELEAQQSRHSEQVAELQARAETNALLAERLKAEILSIAQSRSASEADLQAAQAEIADLRAKLADTEITKRSMSSLLEGMGIRLH